MNYPRWRETSGLEVMITGGMWKGKGQTVSKAGQSHWNLCRSIDAQEASANRAKEGRQGRPCRNS